MTCENDPYIYKIVTRFLGIDPGGTTGLVVAHLVDENPLEVVWHGQEDDFLQLCNWLELILPSIDLVICERFVPRATQFVADAPSACEPIGVIKYLCNKMQKKLILPVPSARKLVTDAALRQSGYWIKGEEHARQALKHVLARVTGEMRDKPTLERLHPRTMVQQ